MANVAISSRKGQDTVSKTDISKMIFRVPMDLREWLDTKAKAERRHMTGQLLHILEQAKQADEAKAKAA